MQQQEQQPIYYMVVDEKSTGPFSLDEVILHPSISPETLVWKPGLDNWVAAKTLPELAPAFVNNDNPTPNTPPEFHRTSSQEETDYNYSSWQSSRDYNHSHEEKREYNPFASNPQYQNNHRYNHSNYERHNRYNYDYRPNFRVNWLPWAIVATVLGFFTSCIGAIFGIIGIVQANRANNLYAQGFDREGDAANSNAKIMTVIGLIFAGLGILAIFFFSNIFSIFSNVSYY